MVSKTTKKQKTKLHKDEARYLSYVMSDRHGESFGFYKCRKCRSWHIGRNDFLVEQKRLENLRKIDEAIREGKSSL